MFSRFLIPRAINVSYNRKGVILYLCMVLFAFYILLIILNVVLAFINMILMSMSDYPVVYFTANVEHVNDVTSFVSYC